MISVAHLAEIFMASLKLYLLATACTLKQTEKNMCMIYTVKAEP